MQYLFPTESRGHEKVRDCKRYADGDIRELVRIHRGGGEAWNLKRSDIIPRVN
jgi:hypothetical protein